MNKKQIQELLLGKYPDNTEEVLEYLEFFNEKDTVIFTDIEIMQDFEEFCKK